MMSRISSFRPALVATFLAVACGGDALPRRTQLTLGAPVVTVGVLQGTRSEMFGAIGDVVALPSGEFFVLDTGNQEIRRYDAGGALHERIGRPGSGPGEFRAATDIAVTTDGYLAVIDEATRELSIYRVRPDSLEYAHKHQLPFVPRQMCAVASRLFVLGLHESLALHEVTLAGRVRNSFATVPGVVDPQVSGSNQTTLRDMYATGQLACIDGRQPIVAYVPETFPVIRAFTADGRSLWQVTIDDYHEFRRSQDTEGFIRFRPDPDVMRTHRATGFSAIDKTSFVLQLMERDYEREEQVGLESRIVHAATGEIVPLPDTLPQLSEAVVDRVYAWRSDPFPQVFVFELPHSTAPRRRGSRYDLAR